MRGKAHAEKARCRQGGAIVGENPDVEARPLQATRSAGRHPVMPGDGDRCLAVAGATRDDLGAGRVALEQAPVKPQCPIIGVPSVTDIGVVGSVVRTAVKQPRHRLRRIEQRLAQAVAE